MNEHHRSAVQPAEPSGQISVPYKRNKRGTLTLIRCAGATVEKLLFDGGALA